MSRIGTEVPGTVLEVGFGAGAFMEWARHSGFTVYGLEIILELIEAGQAAGFEVGGYDVANGASLKGAPDFLKPARFDAIVAFDVIEHMDAATLKGFFEFAESVLLPGGCILARFPNGGSPFGLRLQNGDNTHRLALTQSQLEQFLVGTGLRLKFCGNAFHVVGDGPFSWIKYLAFGIRNILECFFGLLYFNRRIPLDPALTVVIEKTKEKQ